MVRNQGHHYYGARGGRLLSSARIHNEPGTDPAKQNFCVDGGKQGGIC